MVDEDHPEEEDGGDRLVRGGHQELHVGGVGEPVEGHEHDGMEHADLRRVDDVVELLPGPGATAEQPGQLAVGRVERVGQEQEHAHEEAEPPLRADKATRASAGNVQHAPSNVTWLGLRPATAARAAGRRPRRRLTQHEYGGAPAPGF